MSCAIRIKLFDGGVPVDYELQAVLTPHMQATPSVYVHVMLLLLMTNRTGVVLSLAESVAQAAPAGFLLKTVQKTRFLAA
jgi:hypothetical protein